MSRTWSVLIWLLAVVWLPGTLHCSMESAGVFVAIVDHCCAEEATAEQEADGTSETGAACTALEAEFLQQGGDAAKVPAPVLMALLYEWLSPSDPAEEPVAGTAVSPATTDSPPELSGTWSFVRRAAGSPRAPSIPV